MAEPWMQVKSALNGCLVEDYHLTGNEVIIKRCVLLALVIMDSIQFPVEARHLVQMVTSWVQACELRHRQEEERRRQLREQSQGQGHANERPEVQTNQHWIHFPPFLPLLALPSLHKDR